MLNETIYLGYAILMSIKQNCRNFGMTTQNKHILMELNYAALLQINFIIYIRLQIYLQIRGVVRRLDKSKYESRKSFTNRRNQKNNWFQKE